MQIKIKWAGFFIVILLLNACSPKTQKTGLFIYSFEETAPIKTSDSKKLISTYLGVNNPHELTVSTDENIAYYVDDTDPNTKFEQHLGNGNFAFSKVTKAYMNTIPTLPSKEAAVKIAEDYLKAKALFPKNNSELRLVHSGGLRSQNVINQKQAGAIIDHLITLTYGRVIDSIPVIGAGSKIIVKIGDKGEVYGLTRDWRETVGADKKDILVNEIITEDAAKELAKVQIASEFGKNARFEIVSSKKSYYDDNGKILQPVWAFNTLINLGDNANSLLPPVKYLCVIPLLKNSPEPLNLLKVDARSKSLIRTTNNQRDTTQTGGKKDND